MTDPVPLPGGNSNAPVRIGDAVHRIAGPWSPTVHAWLRHLRAAGVAEVPEPLGFDAEGREVMRFLPGTVPAYPMPEAAWSTRLLVDAGRLLRRIHDAGAGFDRGGRIWQQPSRVPDETIAMNDYAPYNLVLGSDGDLVGVIDLDQASPGPRVRDLAHLAYRLVALTAPGNPDVPLRPDADRAARLRLLADAYGGPGPRTIAAAVPGLLRDVADHADAHGRPTHADLYRADRAWNLRRGAAVAALAEEER